MLGRRRMSCSLGSDGSTTACCCLLCLCNHFCWSLLDATQLGVDWCWSSLPVRECAHRGRRVGDLIKFGQSTRMYVFCGPAELMPEEGLTRDQKRHLATLEVAPPLSCGDQGVQGGNLGTLQDMFYATKLAAWCRSSPALGLWTSGEMQMDRRSLMRAM